MKRLILVAALALSGLGGVCAQGGERTRRPARDTSTVRDVRDPARWVVGYASIGGDTSWLDAATIVRTDSSAYEAWWRYRHADAFDSAAGSTGRWYFSRMESDCARLRIRDLESEYRNDLGATVGTVRSRHDLGASADGQWSTVRPQSVAEAMLRSVCDRVRGANLPIANP